MKGLLEQAEIRRIKASVAAGQTDVESDVVDMSGYNDFR